jgi:hypothetical protein
VTGWMERGLALIPPQARGSLPALAATTTVLSNLVSNVPAVLLLLLVDGSAAGPLGRFRENDQLRLLLRYAWSLGG